MMRTEQPPPAPAPESGLPPRIQTFAALRHREFRLFWLGLVVSNLGGWIQQVAGPWLVYRLTDSPFMLGLVGFLAAIPAAPLSLIAGPLIDRLPRRPLLIVTQLGLSLPPMGLAALVWTGHVQVWHVVVAELLRGAFLAIDQPAKQAAIVDMTGKEDVASAIALWSSATSVTRVVGPAIAGLIIAWAGDGPRAFLGVNVAWAGVGLCFALNGLSYLALVAALLAISLPNPQPTARRSSLAGSLADGFRYVLQQRQLVAIASLALVAAVFVRPFQTLLPVFANDVLRPALRSTASSAVGVGATGLGFMTAAAGVGAVVGALGAASLRPERVRESSFVWVASLVLPFVAVGFAFSHSFLLACGFLILLGGWETALETAVNSLLLVEVRDEYRGRVMSLYTAAAMGAPRVGGLQAGWLAARWSAPLALGIGSVVYLMFSGTLLVVLRVAKSKKRG